MVTQKSNSRLSAFTLVEMAIVLTIIGLIVGGVLVGSGLIKSAEMKDINSQTAKLTAAIRAFRDKYGYLPGDMPNATMFWGAQYAQVKGDTATCLANYAGAGATSAATCDGNGNGRIDNTYEHYRTFQHLSNAGMIEGQFTGVRNNGVAQGTYAGVNVMGSKRPNVGIDIVYDDLSVVVASIVTPPAAGHYLFIAASSWNQDQLSLAGLNTKEAYLYDLKFDDGLPTTGQIINYYTNAFNSQCLDATNTQYDVITNGEALNTGALGPGCQLRQWVFN